MYWIAFFNWSRSWVLTLSGLSLWYHCLRFYYDADSILLLCDQQITSCGDDGHAEAHYSKIVMLFCFKNCFKKNSESAPEGVMRDRSQSCGTCSLMMIRKGIRDWLESPDIDEEVTPGPGNAVMKLETSTQVGLF
jgi:hypothetical protein